MDGYLRFSGRVPGAEERLVLCFALENFVALWNWVERCEDQLAGEASEHLRSWLAGSHPWWVRSVGSALG